MYKSLGIGCFALSLFGWGSPLIAQDGAWRSVARPSDNADAAGRTTPMPGRVVSIGRPIAASSNPGEPIARGTAPSPVAPDQTDFAAERIIAVAHQAEAEPLAAPRAVIPPLPDDSSSSKAEPPSDSKKDAPATLSMPTKVAPATVGAPVPLQPGAPYCVYAPPDITDGVVEFKDVNGANSSRFWVKPEYLFWSTKSEHIPPLFTTGNPANVETIDVNGKPVTLLRAGFLDQPDTKVLYGGTGINGDLRSGFRLTAGFWYDADDHESDHDEGLEFSGFVLGNRSSSFAANSTQYPVITRPFYNVNLGREFAEIVASPGISTGNVSSSAPSNFWGLEVNEKCNLCCDCSGRTDVFAGFRYLNLKEGLTINENIMGNPMSADPTFSGDNISSFDRFTTQNQFYGAQIGVATERNWGSWSLDGKFKLGLGDTHQQVNISGVQVVVDRATGASQASLGGLYTAPANAATGYPGNIGQFNRDRFSFVPELDLAIAYHLNPNWKVFVGYNFLYWSDVVRPGDQIDRVIDVANVPRLNFGLPATGQYHPAVLFKSSDFWAQGVNFGVEWKF